MKLSMLPDVYFQYSVIIDFIIALILFYGVSSHSLKNRLDNRYVHFAVAISLAISLTLFESEYHYSLANIRLLVVFILAMVVIFIVGKFISVPTKNYDNVIASNQIMKNDLIKAIEEIKKDNPVKAIRLIQDAELLEKQTDKIINKLKRLDEVNQYGYRKTEKRSK